MRKCFFYTLTVLAALMLMCACHPFHGHCATSAALQDDDILDIQIGGLKMLAIKDAPVTFEMSLLPDMEKYPDAKKLYDSGPLGGVARVYYFTNGEHKIMVDSGWGGDLALKGRTKELMAKRGIKPEDITDILLTHMDFDHIGGLTSKGKALYPNAVLWVAKPEFDAWKTGKVKARPKQAIDLAKSVIKAYDGRTRQIEYGAEIFPGVVAREATGHTPGHTVWDIGKGDDRITIAGDLIHVAPVQFAHPDLSTTYDMDMLKAAETRAKILEKAAADKNIFAGMHFSKIGQVRSDGKSGYEIAD